MIDKLIEFAKTKPWYVAIFVFAVLVIPVLLTIVIIWLKNNEIARLRNKRDVLNEKIEHNKAIIRFTENEIERNVINADISSIYNEIKNIDSNVIMIGEDRKLFEYRLNRAVNWSDFQ